MKKIIALTFFIIILSFSTGYFTAVKREVLTDEQLEEFFNDNARKIFIDQFYQYEVDTTYTVAKTLQSIRDNDNISHEDIERLESILKDNKELFDALYREYPERQDLVDKAVKQIEYIKSYRIKYMGEQP